MTCAVNGWGKRTCPATGKRRYRDKREAVTALHRAQNAGQLAEDLGLDSNRREVRSYQCPSCQGWHLTSWLEWYATPKPDSSRRDSTRRSG